MKAADMLGQRFGRLVVVETARVKMGRDNRMALVCACDCGQTTQVMPERLRGGVTRSCGCFAQETKERLSAQRTADGVTSRDMTGERFGRLLVVRPAPPQTYTYARGAQFNRRWECQCDCGRMIIADVGNLHYGRTKGCGCGRTGEHHITHGHTRGARPSHEYESYVKMIGRCENRKNPKWRIYGGRGIRICHRWRHDFLAFFTDMGPRPTATHSIDRIDNNAGYTCGRCDDCMAGGATANCRWATRSEQARNTRTVRKLEFGGKVMSLPDWADAVGISADAIKQRLKRGWPVGRALTVALRVTAAVLFVLAIARPARADQFADVESRYHAALERRDAGDIVGAYEDVEALIDDLIPLTQTSAAKQAHRWLAITYAKAASLLSYWGDSWRVECAKTIPPSDKPATAACLCARHAEAIKYFTASLAHCDSAGLRPSEYPCSQARGLAERAKSKLRTCTKRIAKEPLP